MKKIVKIILALIVALILIVFGLSMCGGTLDSLPDDQATKENPADPTQKVTIEDYYGVFSIKLDNTYVGSEALDFLGSIGENPEDFDYSDSFDGEYAKTVVQEFTVSADEGFEDEDTAFSYASVIGNDMWDTEYKSKYEYIVPDLYENADLDYYQLTLTKGESSKMYFVFAIPEDVDKYVSSISGVNRDFWFLYDVA